jgi:hypothetical protein
MRRASGRAVSGGRGQDIRRRRRRHVALRQRPHPHPARAGGRQRATRGRWLHTA